MHPTNLTTYFRTASFDKSQGTALADYLAKTKQYKTAYIMQDTGPYAQGFAQAFKDEWTKITGTPPSDTGPIPSTTTTSSGYQGIIQSISNSPVKPDVIFYAGNTPAATLIHGLMEQNPELQATAFAVGGGIMNASFAIHIGGSQSGPVYAVSPIGKINNANSTNFYANYISTYNDLPTQYSGSAYDCTNIVINAIQAVINGTLSGISAMTPPTGPNDRAKANSFRQKVIAAIHQTSYDGVTDHYTFDNNGDTHNQAVSMYELNMTSLRWEYISL